jgi:hypothetical protein
MKSVMEEASSIMKAIEKGWMSAGQPKEFTVKIFEEPQKNFIGLTVRSAKIGIFFSEDQAAKTPETQKQKTPQRHPQAQPVQKEYPPATQRQKPKEYKPRPSARPLKEQRAPEEIKYQEPVETPTPQAPSAPMQPVWTDAMVDTVKEWTRETLSLLNLSGIQFTIEPQHFHLRINFSHPLFDDRGREKQLFASLSTLFLQMLKHRHHRPLKGYKIVFIGA